MAQLERDRPAPHSPTQVALELFDSKVSNTGVTINTYRRAGEIDTGSFEFDEPTEAEPERCQHIA